MVYDPRQDPAYANNRLFLSLIKQESRFNPNAVSPTGARGYTQVLPSTARDPGFGLTPNVNALSDPKQNVEFGKKYFDMLLKRYNGDKAAALVGFNGGPGAADRWLKNGKNDKVISSESRNYYKTILADAGGNGDYAGFKNKPRVKMPDSEEAEAPRTVTGKKINVRSTEETAVSGKDTNPMAVSVKPADTGNSTTDNAAEPERVAVPSSTTSTSDASEQSSSFDLDVDFGKVRRTPQLRGFAAQAFVPFANQDDPRFR